MILHAERGLDMAAKKKSAGPIPVHRRPRQWVHENSSRPTLSMSESIDTVFVRI